MTDETFYYCKEIVRQIQYADPNAMNCWGVIVGHNCFALPESKERRAGIKMDTNGFKHKGRVDVDLTWADDYTIKVLRQEAERHQDFGASVCARAMPYSRYPHREWT